MMRISRTAMDLFPPRLFYKILLIRSNSGRVRLIGEA
jgi:hypothetical protein